jgi:hypothetical protein
MGLRFTLLTVILAASALLATPAAGSASAAPRPGPRRVVRFKARGSHGYKIWVYAPLGRRSRVAIDVEDFKGGAQYVATGTVTPTRIDASFGRLGRISMHFKPSGKVLHSHIEGDASCPNGARARSGTFSGTFRFRGEQGYTEVDLHKVEGGVGAPTAPINAKEELDLGCFHEEALAEPPRPTTLSLPFDKGEALVPGALYLYGSAPTATGHAFIGASPFVIKGLKSKAPVTLVIAMVQEEVEGVKIGRITLGAGKSAEVLPDSGTLDTTTLTPGAPFTGSATYTAGPTGTGTLEGDLSVPMLGAGSVPFAGPTFQAQLLRPETQTAK